jgi:hypothetical protein
MGKINNIGTYTATSTGGPNSNGVYAIQQSDGVNTIGFELSSGGSATLTGSSKIGSFGLSTAVALTALKNTIITCGSDAENIDGLTLTVISGTVTVYTNQ